MINIGVIGTGIWGKNHIRVFKELENVNLVKISDLNEEKLNNLKKTFNLKTTKNYKEILEDKEISAVSICTPASTHYEIIKDALNHNKHVLTEKPITLNSKQAEELIELAKLKNKILMVGHIFRFNSAVLKLKEEIKKNTFGDIRFLYGSRLGLMTPRQDCGVIFDFALHDIDTFIFLLEKQPNEITAVNASYTNNKFEDVGIITLKFDDNIIANVIVSWLTPKKIRDLWLVGDNKCAKLDYLNQELHIFDKGIIPEYDSFGSFKLITQEGDEHKIHIENKEPLKEEIKHFINCIENNEKCISDAKVGLDVVKLIESAYKSIQEKKTIYLK